MIGDFQLAAQGSQKERKEAQEVLANTREGKEVEDTSSQALPVAELTSEGVSELLEATKAEFSAKAVIAQEKAHKAKGDNTKRDLMFTWALVLVTIMLGFTILFVTWYMGYAMLAKQELPELVLVTWMTSTVVEAIGIVLIIAKYLFPSSTEADSVEE